MHYEVNFNASGLIMQLVAELVCEPVSLITVFFFFGPDFNAGVCRTEGGPRMSTAGEEHDCE